MTTTSTPFTKLKNPYTFGVPVSGEDTFFGREREMQYIFDTLDNVPRGQKQDIVVLGPRRIGKSSLLRRLVRLLLQPQHDFTPIYIDLQAVLPRETETLLTVIADAIRKGYAAKGVQNLPSLATLGADPIPPALRFMTFNDDMDRLNTAIAADDLPRLVLMFDEVEELLSFNEPGILGWLRSLIQNTNYAVFVVSGSDQVYALTQDYGSPFYNIFKAVELFPLDAAAARQLIEEPATRIGLTIPPALVDKMLAYSGNNPYFVQGMAHYLIEETNRRERATVTEADLDKVIIGCVQTLSAQFNYFWGVVTTAQRLLLYTLAKIGRPLIADALFDRLPDARAALPGPRERREAFDRLVQQQILSRDAGDRYWFVVPLFAEWLLATVKDEDITHPADELQADAPEGSGLRRLMTLVYPDADLQVLASLHFGEVFQRVTTAAPKPELIAALVLLASERGQLERLAGLVQQAYPHQYEAMATVIPLPAVAPAAPTRPPSAPLPLTAPQWRQLLSDQFSSAELEQLALELRLEYSQLPGETKATKAGALVRLLEQQNRLGELSEAFTRARPEVVKSLAAAPEVAVDRQALLNSLTAYFSAEELRALFYDLGAPPDMPLEGPPTVLAANLIRYAEERRRTPDLLTMLSHQRPNVDWLARPEPVAAPTIDPVALRKVLDEHFNSNDLQSLAFDLGIDYENLRGTVTASKWIELINYMQRRNRLPELVEAVRRARPELDWSQYAPPGTAA